MQKKIKHTPALSIDDFTAWLKNECSDWSADSFVFKDTERDFEHGGGFSDIGVDRPALKLTFHSEILNVIFMPWGLQLYWSGNMGFSMSEKISSKWSTF